MNKPIVVCLCGSTRFKDAYEKAMREETLKGNIVLTVGLFGHLEGMDMNGETKKMLDELHLRKIDLADEVLIINVGKYIGQSTSRELEYAKKNGKKIRYLEQIEEQKPENEINRLKCPICGGWAIATCRCPRSDSMCNNAHQWHTCLKHQKIVLGESDHSRPTLECTCKEE